MQGTVLGNIISVFSPSTVCTEPSDMKAIQIVEFLDQFEIDLSLSFSQSVWVFGHKFLPSSYCV